MNTAANSQNIGGQGTDQGFAIPINTALAVAKNIAAGKASAKIQLGPSGFIGVGVGSITDASCLNSGGSFGGPGVGYTPPVSSGALVCQVSTALRPTRPGWFPATSSPASTGRP